VTAGADHRGSHAPAILLVADQLEHLQAGTEGQMLALCNGLLELGWRVELAVLRGADKIRDRWPTPVHEIGVQSLSTPRAWWRACRFALLARGAGFRLTQIFFNDAAIVMPPLLKAAGLAVVVARRDMGFWYTPGQLRALRTVRRFVDRVVANSRAVAANVAGAEGYTPGQISVIYNGVAMGESTADSIRVSTPQDGSAEPLVVGLVANIRPVKRVQDAVAAFARVAPKHPASVLEIVGDGDTAGLERQVASLGLAGRVRFTGRVADVRARLPAYAVCILTSETEGLSNAIIEYMLAARPVVCTETGGNPEVVEHGTTGYLYPVGDTEALAVYLDRLLADPTLRRAMGEAGRDRAEARCSLQTMVKAYEELYFGILEGALPSPRRLPAREGGS